MQINLQFVKKIITEKVGVFFAIFYYVLLTSKYFYTFKVFMERHRSKISQWNFIYWWKITQTKQNHRQKCRNDEFLKMMDDCRSCTFSIAIIEALWII